MQLPWDEHFFEIVIPAWQAYLAAEAELTAAHRGGVAAEMSRARYKALREAGAASFFLHHYAEIVLRARPPWLPHEIKNLGEVRKLASAHCTRLRSDAQIDDVGLLHDVADALKHAVLTRNPDRRMVAANEAVLVSRTGYGGGRFGEGKFGGAEQVLVLAKGDQRALSAVLQNVVDAWRRLGGIELPEINEP